MDEREKTRVNNLPNEIFLKYSLWEELLPIAFRSSPFTNDECSEADRENLSSWD